MTMIKDSSTNSSSTLSQKCKNITNYNFIYKLPHKNKPQQTQIIKKLKNSLTLESFNTISKPISTK